MEISWTHLVFALKQEVLNFYFTYAQLDWKGCHNYQNKNENQVYYMKIQEISHLIHLKILVAN